MRIGILAEKLGMSRYYDKNSANQAVTLLKVSNCKVISIQSKDKNGYNSITLSHGKSKNPNKPFKTLRKHQINSRYLTETVLSRKYDEVDSSKQTIQKNKMAINSSYHDILVGNRIKC